MSGTAVNFTPRRRSGVRLRMALDEADRAKIRRGGPWSAEVTDRLTGKRWLVEGAACSSPGCFCDAVVVREVR